MALVGFRGRANRRRSLPNSRVRFDVGTSIIHKCKDPRTQICVSMRCVGQRALLKRRLRPLDREVSTRKQATFKRWSRQPREVAGTLGVVAKIQRNLAETQGFEPWIRL